MKKHSGGSAVLDPPVQHHHGKTEPVTMQDEQPPPASGQDQSQPAGDPAAGALLAAPPAPELLANPPLFNKTPTTAAQLQNLVPATKGSHFSGPVVSGIPGPPATGAATSAISGSASLTVSYVVDYTMGNFNLAVVFPPNAILLWAQAITLTAWAATDAQVSLWKTSGAADILALTSFPAAAGGAVWAAVAGALPANWTAFLNVSTNTGDTAGQGIVTLGYARPALPWN